MMGKTHLAVGIASAYLILQPKTPSEFAVATIGGSVGGVMADIDVKIEKNRQNKIARKLSMDALYGEILAATISASVLAGDYFNGNQILQRIDIRSNTVLIGLGLFIALTVVGELSKKHRDRTHSLLALFLFSASVYLVDPEIGIAFLIGYSSHLLLDVLNKKDIRLLYPIRGGLCLHICYSDGVANELFFAGGVALIAVYLYMYGKF